MPTAKDVTALRKAGQLDEAFNIANELLATDPGNIWTRRAMGWVRYERLKGVSKAGSLGAFTDEWTAITALVADAPADEVMLTNNVAWLAVNRLFTLGDSDKADKILNLVFSSLQQWTLERPSELFSALLKACLKGGKTWSGLGRFLSWWNLTNLRPEDYLPAVFVDGKKGMALAEQAYVAYTKQLLLYPEPQAVKLLIDQLETLAEHHPEYQYPPYYQAKLLASTGSKDEALAALLPFARRKQREFWIWDLLADLFADESEKAIACLCRAVSCPTQEKFLVKVRQKLATKLIEQNQFNEALTEMTQVIDVRVAEGWRVTDRERQVIERLTQSGAVPVPDEKKRYRRYLSLTDELLYADVPEQIGVVTHLNTDKKIAHFMVNRAVSGHFKYEGKLAEIQPSNSVAVRLEERVGKEGKFWVPLSVKTTEQVPSEDVYKSFSGPLKRIDGKDFGFVRDVFIVPVLLKELSTVAEEIVSGKAILSFDKSKQAFGWKAVEVS